MSLTSINMKIFTTKYLGGAPIINLISTPNFARDITGGSTMFHYPLHIADLDEEVQNNYRKVVIVTIC